MAAKQERSELDSRARHGETEHLAEERSRGGQTRKDQLGTEGYQQMGRKGGLSTGEKGGGERGNRDR
ncbi:hypothetical protein ACS0TY_033885 [Phlomoides rotata]